MTGRQEPDEKGRADRSAEGIRRGVGDEGRADREATPMRGVWVAIVILGGAAIVFLLLALTSGALSL